jgi:membrane protease YdiL (CAAX protease family)
VKRWVGLFALAVIVLILVIGFIASPGLRRVYAGDALGWIAVAIGAVIGAASFALMWWAEIRWRRVRAPRGGDQ